MSQRSRYECSVCGGYDGDDVEPCICESLCDACGGNGVTYEDTVDSEGWPDMIRTQCPICGGTGEAP